MKSDKLAQITDRQMPALWIPRFLNEFVFFLFLITFLATCSNSVEIDDTGDFPLASANPIILDCSGKNNIFGSRREAVRLGYRGLNIYKRSTPDPRGTSVFEIEDSKSCRAKIRGNSISYGPMEFVEGTTGIDHSSGM